VVHLGSVPIDSGSGLGAEVAVPGVEIECTDAVFAADTLELYSPFDPIGRVVSHGLIVVRCSGGRTHHGGRWAVEGNLWSPLCEHEPITLRDVRVGGHFRQYNLPAARNRKMRGCMTRRFVLHADQSERVPRHD
jgi:hypothetical protein